MPAIAKSSVWTEPKCSYFAAEKNHQMQIFRLCIRFPHVSMNSPLQSAINNIDTFK